MIDLNKYLELLNMHESIMSHHDIMFENQAENSKFQRANKAQKRYIADLEKQRALSNATFNKALDEFLAGEGYKIKAGAKTVTKKGNNPFGFFARIFKRKKISAELEFPTANQLTNSNPTTSDADSTTLVPIKQDIVAAAQKDELENQTNIDDTKEENCVK